MNKKNSRSLLLLLYFITICTLIISGCAKAEPDPISPTTAKEDIIDYLHSNLSEDVNVEYVELMKPDEIKEEGSDYTLKVRFIYGDITYVRFYTMNYSYSRAFGWKNNSISETDRDSWYAGANELTSDKILSDLEERRYFSGYSDGLFENRRLLSSSISEQELNAEAGYSRITMTAVLNADNVHEILEIYLEYLLNTSNEFELSTCDITLGSVEVQGKVSEELIKDSLNAVNFYREEENSTWKIGELNKVTYETVYEELDTVNNTDIVEISFRGEGTYMYVAGTVTFIFHFSSGWYLYDSEIDTASLETGMLSDAWLINEDMLISTIVADYPFSYDSINDYELSEDMIQNMTITDRRITDNGQFQVVYFEYDLVIGSATFKLSGYGKYSLSDGYLSVDTWNEIVGEVSFNLTGTWRGIELLDNYLAVYELNITDDDNGLLSGSLKCYGIDLQKDPNNLFNVELTTKGNIYQGIKYEIMEDTYLIGDFKQGICIPRGYYDFTNETLACENSKDVKMKLKRGSDEIISQDSLIALIRSGGIQSYLQQLKSRY